MGVLVPVVVGVAVGLVVLFFVIWLLNRHAPAPTGANTRLRDIALAVLTACLVTLAALLGGDLAVGSLTAGAVVSGGVVVWDFCRSRRASSAVGMPGPNRLQQEVKHLDDELLVGREILRRCDDDDVWEPSPNAATEKEVHDWERRVLRWLPGDWRDDFRSAVPVVHAPNDPISELAKRVNAKLFVLWRALRDRHQYLFLTDPEAELPPDREDHQGWPDE